MIAGKRDATIPNLLAIGSQLTELRGQVNQVRYQLLVALAGLERATAGGYCPDFEFAPTCDPIVVDESSNKDNEKDKKEQDGKPEKLQRPKVELND